jgi:cell division protein FtsL
VQWGRYKPHITPQVKRTRDLVRDNLHASLEAERKATAEVECLSGQERLRRRECHLKTKRTERQVKKLTEQLKQHQTPTVSERKVHVFLFVFVFQLFFLLTFMVGSLMVNVLQCVKDARDKQVVEIVSTLESKLEKKSRIKSKADLQVKSSRNDKRLTDYLRKHMIDPANADHVRVAQETLDHLKLAGNCSEDDSSGSDYEPDEDCEDEHVQGSPQVMAYLRKVVGHSVTARDGTWTTIHETFDAPKLWRHTVNRLSEQGLARFNESAHCYYCSAGNIVWHVGS